MKREIKEINRKNKNLQTYYLFNFYIFLTFYLFIFFNFLASKTIVLIFETVINLSWIKIILKTLGKQ